MDNDAIKHAIEGGDLSQLDRLLPHPDHVMDGSRVLFAALRCGRLDSVRYLLRKGASPSLEPGDKASPVIVAIMERRPDLLKEVCAKGADLEQKIDGLTPLQFCLRDVETVGLKVLLIKVLLKAGADVNPTNGTGATPLDEALSGDLPELAELLRAHGAYSTSVSLSDPAVPQDSLSKRPASYWEPDVLPVSECALTIGRDGLSLRPLTQHEKYQKNRARGSITLFADVGLGCLLSVVMVILFGIIGSCIPDFLAQWLSDIVPEWLSGTFLFIWAIVIPGTIAGLIRTRKLN